MTKENRPLSSKHQEFIRQYFLNGRNASKAYKKTYPASKNPDVDAAKLLVKPSIQAEIQLQESKIEAKFEVTLERIVQEYAAIAFGSIDRLVDWDVEKDEDGKKAKRKVRIKPKDQIGKSDLAFIDSITFYGDSASVYTLAKEKTKALDALVKLLGYDKRDEEKGDSWLAEAFAQLDKEKDRDGP